MRGRGPSRLSAWGAAKVNIGWRVGARRPDGYHEVLGHLHSISLADRLDIERAPADEGVRVSVPAAPELEGPGNLVAAAAAALASARRGGGARIVVHKQIPVAAGLGGGSADAAAALAGLNALWRTRLRPRELLDLAAEIGSDVPGVLLGGLVHVSGRGEVVRAVGAATDGWFVLGVATEHVAAADAYAALRGSRVVDPGAWEHNDLEAAACALVPGLAERLAAMRSAAGVAFVSGSGPTVAGVAASQEAAREVAERVRSHFADVVVARPVDWGVRVTIGGKGAPA